MDTSEPTKVFNQRVPTKFANRDDIFNTPDTVPSRIQAAGINRGADITDITDTMDFVSSNYSAAKVTPNMGFILHTSRKGPGISIPPEVEIPPSPNV